MTQPPTAGMLAGAVRSFDAQAVCGAGLVLLELPRRAWSSVNDHRNEGAFVMQRFKLLGLALVAVFASAAALSTSAFSALPQNLPEVAFERTWTGASDGEGTDAEPKLLSGASEVKCKEAPATGTEESKKPLGLLHITFKGCKGFGGVACTGLGDAAETILALGSWHLVFDKLGAELLTAVLILTEHVHFSCSALVLVLVLGALVCLHLKPTESNTTHLFHCVIQANGEQEDKTYEDANGNSVTAILLCSINEAATEEPCAELALGSVTYLEKIFADI
jgi:hypothetical protein